MNNYFYCMPLFFCLCLSSCATSADINSKPLSQWLSSHQSYRLATASDCDCEFVIKHNKKEIGNNYNPYRIESDLDKDGKVDLAVVVVNKSNQSDFLILVFASHLAHGERPLVYGKMVDDENLVGLGLAVPLYEGRRRLLFGTLNAEGAEEIIIPLEY